MAKPKPPSVKTGEILGGRYKVERVIGAGGVGIVVEARHLELRTRVAVKLLTEEALDDEDHVERFMREARAAVRLKSVHSAKVLDVGRLDDGAPFMVMELLTGSTLADLIDKEPLAPAVAVHYVLQVCEAVAEAHALKIVHRDLKPSNLFLTQHVDGTPLVKVLDFGLAKVARPSETDKLTRTQTVMGSPPYMSPEQLRATRDVDVGTDIWSLGVTLYEMCSRRLPFEAETVPELCVLILKEAPVPLASHVSVPDGLWPVIARCLEKNAADRFANISELATALEPFAAHEARGSAARVSTVLGSTRVQSDMPPAFAAFVPAPAPAPEDAAKPGADLRATGKRRRAAAIGAGALALVAGAVVLGARLWGAAAETTPDRPPATTASAPVVTASDPPPLVTLSSPPPPPATPPPRVDPTIASPSFPAKNGGAARRPAVPGAGPSPPLASAPDKSAKPAVPTGAPAPSTDLKTTFE